jgi:hypothetical protein
MSDNTRLCLRDAAISNVAIKSVWCADVDRSLFSTSLSLLYGQTVFYGHPQLCIRQSWPVLRSIHTYSSVSVMSVRCPTNKHSHKYFK